MAVYSPLSNDDGYLCWSPAIGSNYPSPPSTMNSRTGSRGYDHATRDLSKLFNPSDPTLGCSVAFPRLDDHSSQGSTLPNMSTTPSRIPSLTQLVTNIESWEREKVDTSRMLSPPPSRRCSQDSGVSWADEDYSTPSPSTYASSEASASSDGLFHPFWWSPPHQPSPHMFINHDGLPPQHPSATAPSFAAPSAEARSMPFPGTVSGPLRRQPASHVYSERQLSTRDPTPDTSDSDKPRHNNRKTEVANADFVLYHRTNRVTPWQELVGLYNRERVNLLAYAELKPGVIDTERTVLGVQAMYYRQRNCIPRRDVNDDIMFDNDGEQVTRSCKVRAEEEEACPRVDLISAFPERVVYYQYYWVTEAEMAQAQALAARDHAQRVARGLPPWKPEPSRPLKHTSIPTTVGFGVLRSVI